MECLDANVVQDLMSGALDEAARGLVLGHLDTCDDCRELLGVTASDTLQNIGSTQPYPVKLVAPRNFALDATVAPGADIGLDETRAPGLGETVATAGPGGGVPAPGGGALTPFGRYQLHTRLGAGAMGVVWSAHDPKLGRMVALKLLRRQSQELTDRLEREARAMASVSHPNVVGVFDVGVAEGQTYIAMELVKGKSLRAWQTAQRRTVPELVDAYVAAGRGLAAAHQAGIVHRDFKPDNVLVGDDGRARVTDFGLAAAKPSESGTRQPIADVNLTTSGSVLGTPAYMAPEQFEGGHVDPRTDQFNFCASLYEALYGERPFEGARFDELAEHVIEGRIKPEPAGTQVSRGLRAIVVRGLSPKPGDRFPTMDHLLAELGRDRAKPWRRATIAAVTIAIALGLGLVADFAVRDRSERAIQQSFRLTATQLEKTVQRHADHFHTVAQFTNTLPAVRQLANHRDQAEFGLGGTPEADRAELEDLHNTLASADWVGDQIQRAVIDYKGRLLYTSYAPQVWNTDARGLPNIKRALDAGGGDELSILPYADPALVSTQLLGSAPPHGLALMFQRSVVAGDDTAKEARVIYLEIEDAARLLDDIRLDDKTSLALVTPAGDLVGDVDLTPALVRAAPRSGEVAAIREHGRHYAVRSIPVKGLDKTTELARVVMARRLDGVLSLFPGARIVFALAMLAALAVAAVTAFRARGIAGARVA